MSASLYLLQVRAAFDAMCAERRMKPMGKPGPRWDRATMVPVLVIVYGCEAERITRLAMEASNAAVDPVEFDRRMAESRAELGAILAGLPPLE
jgi:hypothetical protein